MGQFDSWNDDPHMVFEASMARLGTLLLAGLMVFAADDHDVIVPVSLDANKLVVIGPRGPRRKLGKISETWSTSTRAGWCHSPRWPL